VGCGDGEAGVAEGTDCMIMISGLIWWRRVWGRICGKRTGWFAAWLEVGACALVFHWLEG